MPRPAPPPPPEPVPRGWPRDALAHPALTGITTAALGELTAALEIPYAARREHDLYTARGHTRASSGGMTTRIPLTDRLLATLIHDHLGIAKKELAPALGISNTTMSHITRQITTLLPAIPQPPKAPPPENPPQTLRDLAAYTTRHTSIPIPPPEPAPPQPATLQTPRHTAKPPNFGMITSGGRSGDPPHRADSRTGRGGRRRVSAGWSG